jgi:hypothetical protein
MAEGKRAASVWAAFGVDTSQAVDGLAKLAKSTEKTLKQVEAAGNKLGGIGLAIGASIAASARVASQHNPKMAASFASISDSMARLSTSLGMLFLPTVDKVAAGLRDLSKWFDGLSPGIKSLIANVGVFSSAGLVGVGMLGKLAGGIGSIISLGMTLAPLLAGIGWPFVLAIGAMVIAIPILYSAWKKNWDSIQNAAKAVFAKLASWWGETVNYLLKTLATWANAAIDTAKKVALAVAGEDPRVRAMVEQGFAMLKVTAQDVSTIIGEGWEALKDGAIEAGSSFGGALMKSWREGVSAMKKDAAAFLGGMGGGTGPEFHSKLGEYDTFGLNGSTNTGELAKLIAKNKAIADGEQRDRQVFYQKLDFTARKYESAREEIQARNATILNVVFAKMGEMGQMVGNVMQAMAQGGPWAAFIAAIMEVLSRLASWQEKQEAAMETINTIMELLNLLFKPFFDILRDITEAITRVVTDIVGIFDPAKAEKMRAEQAARKAKYDRAMDDNSSATKDNTRATRELGASLNVPSGLATNRIRHNVESGYTHNGDIIVVSPDVTDPKKVMTAVERAAAAARLRKKGTKWGNGGGMWDNSEPENP